MSRTVVFVDTSLSKVTSGPFQSRIGREEIGAQLVAACCQAVDWDVRYLRPDTDNYEIVCHLINQGPCDVLTLFPYTYTKWLADEIAQRFKGKLPVVYGGYHAGIGVNAKKVLAEGLSDYVILGRGDNNLPWLLRELSYKKPPIVVVAGKCLFPATKNYPLDALPWPWRNPSLMQNLSQEPLPFKPPRGLESNPRKCVIVAGAIGCSSRCDFCASWLISHRPMHRSPQNIVEEMVALQDNYGPGLVYHFANPLFNADRDWVMELCREMEKKGPFPSICMPDFCLDREMVEAMKRAGFYFVMLGLEFADTGLRTRRGKRAGNPVLAYQLCAQEGILTRAFFMLGRLGMTRKDLEAEVKALEFLPFRADELRINFEVPFPGTKITRSLRHRDIGLLDESRWTTEEAVYRTALSQNEWQEVRRDITRTYHFGQRQKEHYERQSRKFPELAEVYQDFLSRLARKLEMEE